MKNNLKAYQKMLIEIFVGVLLVAVGWRVMGKRVYSSGAGTNLVVVGDGEIALMGVRKDEERLVWVGLPKNLKLNVSGGEASYQTESLWRLGEIEGGSEPLVLKSLSESFGLWFQAVVKVKGRPSVEAVMSRLTEVAGIKGLGFLDRYLLYKDISRLVSKGMVLEMEIPSQIFAVKEDVDGKKWLELNEAVYFWSKNLWPSDEILNKGIKVTVLNASEVAGRAWVATRQLESLGFRVIEVASSERKIDNKCLVESSFFEDKVIKWVLGRQLGCQLVEGDMGTIILVGDY